MQYKNTIIAISPHPDDVALSISHTINFLGKMRPSIAFELVTCFSQSNYTVFSEKFSQDAIPAIRMMEDQRYLSELACCSVGFKPLGLLDAPLRPEWKEGADVQDLDAYEVTEKEIDIYVPLLATLLVKMRQCSNLYLAPLGIFHKDHLICNFAAVSAFEGAPLIFYEDCPYMFIRSPDEVRTRIRAVASAVGTELTPLRPLDEFDLGDWMRCVGVYESQFAREELFDIGNKLKGQGGEIIWANPEAMRWLDQAGFLDQFMKLNSDILY